MIILPPRNQILICHSLSDTDMKWRLRLRTHLQPYERQKVLTIWDFTEIVPGERPIDALTTALREARIAIFLVTPDLLAQKFADEKTLEQLLTNLVENNVRILWLAVRPSVIQTSSLAQYKAIYPTKKSLSEIPASAADAALVKVSEEIIRQYRNLGPINALDSESGRVGSNYEFDGPANDSQALKLSKFSTVVGIAITPISVIGMNLTTANYHKLFLSLAILGGLYVLSGLFFANITMFPSQHRSRVFGFLLGTLIVLTFALGARAAGYVYLARQESSAKTISKTTPRITTERTVTSTNNVVHVDLGEQNLPDLGPKERKIFGTDPSIPKYTHTVRAKTSGCHEPTEKEVREERQRILSERQRAPISPGSSLPFESDDERDRRILEERSQTEGLSNEAIAEYLRASYCGEPTVIPGFAETRKGLEITLFNRIIKRHLNEIRPCFESQLRQDEKLQGRVDIQITVKPGGTVIQSVPKASTLHMPAIETCIASVVKRWEFPSPQGGNFVATYPFIIPSLEEVEARRTQEVRRLIISAMTRYQVGLRTCIKAQRVNDPALKGGIVRVQFTIATDGSVSDSQVQSSDINNLEFQDCVRDRINKWRFGSPGRESIEIRYPIKFE